MAPLRSPAVLCLLPAVLSLLLGSSMFVSAQIAPAPDSTAHQDSTERQPPVLMERPPADLTNGEKPEGRISLDVLVTDASGKPVSGLTEKEVGTTLTT